MYIALLRTIHISQTQMLEYLKFEVMKFTNQYQYHIKVSLGKNQISMQSFISLAYQ